MGRASALLEPPLHIAHVDLDRSVEPIELPLGVDRALLVAESEGAVVGLVPMAGRLLEPAAMAATVEAEIGDALARRRLATRARRALGDRAGGGTRPSTSVVICTLGRPQLLHDCLASLIRLHTRPEEIIVVDNGPDEATARACEPFPVRYVAEPVRGLSRARNRGIAASTGDLIAFTDDDCIADPRWLDGLGALFEDPLLSAVTGYVAPLEIASQAQAWFEMHGGFEMHVDRRVFGGITAPAGEAAALGDGNAIFRRSAVERVGGFDERLGPGTPARSKQDADIFFRLLRAGGRALFDPSRIVWHRHRLGPGELGSVLFDYAAGSGAYVVSCVRDHREPGALTGLVWWWLVHFPQDVGAILRRAPNRLPPRLVAAEMRGLVAGMRAMARERRPPPGGRTVAREAPATTVAVRRELPEISVVIPTFNRRERLVRVLRALGAQTLPPERMEVVVVVDGSTDGSGEAVRAIDLPVRVEVIEQANAGRAAARNRGTEAARHPILLLFDDDIVADPGLAAAHADAHATAHAPTWVQGRHEPAPVTSGFAAQLLVAWWHDHFRRKARPGHVWSFVDGCAGNSSLPRSSLIAAGGFDPRMGIREDWDLALRLRRLGTGWAFRHDASAIHQIDAVPAKVLADRRQEGAADAILATRHPDLWARLPICRLAEPEDPHHSVWRLAAERHAAAGALARAGPVAAARLEAMPARRAWSRLFGGLNLLAYALGVRDTVGDLGGLERLRSAGAGARRAPSVLDLAGSGPALGLDPDSPDVAVRWGPHDLGVVRVLEPGEQWDGEVASSRIADAAAARARALGLTRLQAGSAVGDLRR